MPRGSKPGERRGGRTAGVPNHSTRQLRELAGRHAPAVIKRLAYLASHAKSEQAAVAAGRELLDRYAGKAAQAVTGPDGEALTVPQVVSFVISAAPGATNRT